MAIANIRHSGELPSCLHLLSSQTLGLLGQRKVPTEFDFMNLNGLYRFLEDFKSSELIDRATTGVLGVDLDTTFDEGLAADEAEFTSVSIAAGLQKAYPSINLLDSTKKLQLVLVSLAGLKPKQAVTTNDTDSAKEALTVILEKLTSPKSQPAHA